MSFCVGVGFYLVSSLNILFVVGSLLRLDWGMVSRGPFELDTFVYLEFLYKFVT